MMYFFRFLQPFTILFAILCLFHPPLLAQEQVGLRMERYAGIYSAALNPAFVTAFPLKWEFNVGQIDIHAQNDYIFLRNTSLPHLFANRSRLQLAIDTSSEFPIKNPLVIDYADETKETYGTFNSRISGPSFSYNINERINVGIFTAHRAHGQIYNIPATLSNDFFSNYTFRKTIDVGSFRGGGVVWSEIGLNIAINSKGKSDQVVHSFGISPKVLLGHQAVFANSRQPLQLTRVTRDSMVFSNATWEYGVTDDFIQKNTNIQPRDFFKSINGFGIGFSLGYSLMVPDDQADSPTDYKMRFGISLLDVGSINFDNNAEDHVLSFEAPVGIRSDKFVSLEQFPDFINRTSEAFLQDSAASFRSEELTATLPMGISVQFDRKIAKNIYAGGYLVQRVAFINNAQKRVNVVAVSPRYESKYLTVSTPLVVHDYKRVQLGLAARVGWLTLGTDHLGSFFKAEKMYGTNFYVGLKVNAFELKSDNYRLGKRDRHWRGTPCYKF